MGLFLEIEATDPDTIEITDEERVVRKRRLSFYERAGARVMCEQAIYLTPSYTQVGKEWEGELLAIEFGKPVCKHTISQVILEIYSRFYHLPPHNAMVQKVLAHFLVCDVQCEHPAEPVVVAPPLTVPPPLAPGCKFCNWVSGVLHWLLVKARMFFTRSK